MVGAVLIVGGLTFLPALALGPIVEHFALLAGYETVSPKLDAFGNARRVGLITNPVAGNDRNSVSHRM